jgi:hypothetical protein
MTRRVFAAVAAVRPTRLFLIIDGPRADHPEDLKRCEEVKEIVEGVNWPCRVESNVSAHNMGCRDRIISGLNWVFSQVEEAIIVEDDCVPDPSFFPYCTQLLERYRDCGQIGPILGHQPLEKAFPSEYSYFFSRTIRFWGWATWRRAWQEFDEHMESWPEVKKAGLLKTIFPERGIADYWTRVFDTIYGEDAPTAWGYNWTYTCWTRNWLSIVPRRNLVQNIGFGEDATHTSVVDKERTLSSGPMSFPLQHPAAIIPRHSHDVYECRMFLVPHLPRRIKRKLLLQVLPAIRRKFFNPRPASL